MIVTLYEQADGSCPFDRWFEGLQTEAATKVTRAIQRLEQGNLSSVKWLDGVGEYKIDRGPGLRIYLIQNGDAIVLLWGGIKKRQSADVQKAKALVAEYKERQRKVD